MNFILQALQAIKMQMNGLMIETHYSPKNALSDANQQVSPQQLKELINNIY